MDHSPAMDRCLIAKMRADLEAHRIMTIATLRPDGWPQATIVGFVPDGLRLCFMVARDGQKYANLTRDARASIAIGADTREPMGITGLSMAARCTEVTDPAERARVLGLMLRRYPEYAGFPASAIDGMAVMVALPEIVSVLDYSLGFGHADLMRLRPSETRRVPAEA